MVNLRAVDLNLLTVFEAVYEERNQARAAERLALTQPAVSNAVGRLRHVVRDPLFVPGPRGVAPTPVADRLYPKVRAALDAIRTGLAAERTFDPRTTRQTFTVAAGYGGGAVIGPPLYAWLAAEAPNARLVIRSIDDPALLGRRLLEGRLDAAWDYVEPRDPELRSVVLTELKPVVLVRRDHPRIRRAPTLAQIRRERSVMHVESHEPGALPELDESIALLVGEVAIEVPSALAIPVVVARTDLVGFCGASVAAALAAPLGLRAYPFPAPMPAYATRLIWHAARDADPAQRWLRGGIVEAARRVAAALPGGPAAAPRRRAS